MLKNPYRQEKKIILCEDAPFPSVDPSKPLQLLACCPHYQETPLHRKRISSLNGEVFIKDERGRMGLGSFKALGAAYVIAHMVQQQTLSTTTFVTASAGNHGLSVAVGAKIFGAGAVVYLSHIVPESFAENYDIMVLKSTVPVTIMKHLCLLLHKLRKMKTGFSSPIAPGRAIQNYHID
jgi:diaminopropionate ammonia-lyase